MGCTLHSFCSFGYFTSKSTLICLCQFLRYFPTLAHCGVPPTHSPKKSFLTPSLRPFNLGQSHPHFKTNKVQSHFYLSFHSLLNLKIFELSNGLIVSLGMVTSREVTQARTWLCTLLELRTAKYYKMERRGQAFHVKHRRLEKDVTGQLWSHDKVNPSFETGDIVFSCIYQILGYL